jgi:hypothetical protein
MDVNASDVPAGSNLPVCEVVICGTFPVSASRITNTPYRLTATALVTAPSHAHVNCMDLRMDVIVHRTVGQGNHEMDLVRRPLEPSRTSVARESLVAGPFSLLLVVVRCLPGSDVPAAGRPSDGGVSNA